MYKIVLHIYRIVLTYVIYKYSWCIAKNNNSNTNNNNNAITFILCLLLLNSSI